MTSPNIEESLKPYLVHIETISCGKPPEIREMAINLTLDGIERGIQPFYMHEFAASATAMDMAGDGGLGGDFAIDDKEREEVDDLLFLTGSLPWTSEMSASFASAWYGIELPQP